MNSKRMMLVLALVAIALLVVWAREPRPRGRPGEGAEALAQRMLAAVDAPAWERTGAVAWTFRGQRHHLWDRQRSLAQIRWDDVEVELDLQTRRGLARRQGKELQGKELDEALEQAWQAWCNDSFWLNPVAKIYDPGTRRELVETAHGAALLVVFTEGGVTPGDAYLFRVDSNGLPTRWKMWTKILPIQGLSMGWEGWTTLATGARIATEHPIGPRVLKLTDVRGAATLEDLHLGDDPFARLVAGR